MVEGNKIVRLQFDKFERTSDGEKSSGFKGFLQTNPILQKMFAANLLNGNSGKKKFGMKDLFK